MFSVTTIFFDELESLPVPWIVAGGNQIFLAKPSINRIPMRVAQNPLKMPPTSSV